jgi:hypothetical protein
MDHRNLTQFLSFSSYSFSLCLNTICPFAVTQRPDLSLCRAAIMVAAPPIAIICRRRRSVFLGYQHALLSVVSCSMMNLSLAGVNSNGTE